ncbi:MAG: class I SAM-dependent methyltransferase [Bacteroidetes bacterium]|nr:class I SAM-dependent methyltransferase [Bacteroidota bacterium]
MDDYNAFAADYNEFEEEAVTLWRLGYPVVTGLLGNLKGKSVLDYGCGTGIFSRFLESKGARVTGVDVSERMIEVAKNSGKDTIEYHTISSAGIGFLSDETFDFVVSNFVFCTIQTRGEISLILQQIFRVLKKEGIFIFMNSNWDKSNGKEFVSFRLDFCSNLVSGQPVMAVIKSDPPIVLHDFYWPVDDYREMLEGTGFRVRDYREMKAGSDDVSWRDEKDFPPYYVIVAGKFEIASSLRSSQ